MRSALKGAAELMAVASGATRALRRMRRGQVAVLAYHNVVPGSDRGRGQSTLHVPLSDFRRQMDRLSSTHEIVALGELVEGSVRRRMSGRPLAAITFDDAYSGAVRLAVPELVELGLPATVFVSPARLGGQCFWWDVLADRRGGVLSPEMRRWGLDEMTGDHERILEASGAGSVAGSNGLPESLKSATEADLGTAAGRVGISLGSHGWSHLNMARLSPERLDRELKRPKQWLYSRFQGVLPVVSYPYGLSSTQVRERARRTGYSAGFEISGGWWSEGSHDVLGLPRMNVPSGISLRGFEILTSGLRSRT